MRKGHVIYCNRCGRQLKGTDGTPVEEGLHVEKSWGYFSGKDGEIHSFDLCESCYDLLVQDFQIPPEKKEQKILIRTQNKHSPVSGERSTKRWGGGC